MLDEVDDASHWLAELGVAKYRGVQREADRSAMAGSDSVQADKDAKSASSGCGCSTDSESGWWLLGLCLGAPLFLFRRRALRRTA